MIDDIMHPDRAARAEHDRAAAGMARLDEAELREAVAWSPIGNTPETFKAAGRKLEAEAPKACSCGKTFRNYGRCQHGKCAVCHQDCPGELEVEEAELRPGLIGRLAAHSLERHEAAKIEEELERERVAVAEGAPAIFLEHAGSTACGPQFFRPDSWPSWVWKVRFPNGHVSRYFATPGQLIQALKDAAGNPDRGLTVEVLVQGESAAEKLERELAEDPGGDGGIGAEDIRQKLLSGGRDAITDGEARQLSETMGVDAPVALAELVERTEETEYEEIEIRRQLDEDHQADLDYEARLEAEHEQDGEA